MDARFISNTLLIKAMQRAGVDYAPDPIACFYVACDVQDNLDEDELVLECANTTSPGFHSFLVVTNKRIFLGAGPGELDVLDIRNLTHWRIIEQPDMSLELQVLGKVHTVNGLGRNGVSRIIHALQFVLQSQTDTQSSLMKILDNDWRRIREGSKGE